MVGVGPMLGCWEGRIQSISSVKKGTAQANGSIRAQ